MREEKKFPYPVDLVYLWVDGSDPAWQARRRGMEGGKGKGEDGKDCAGRYADNDELRYSLRSVLKYAPWIHRIFIVTDRQVPRWLDTSNRRVQIVDHSEIMARESIPCFNSVVIEHHLHRIPGLSEHFLYANDDMLINRAVSPWDFFRADGKPRIRLNQRPMRRLQLWAKEHVMGKPLSNYVRTIHRAAKIVEERCGKYYGGHTHHNIDAYLRSSYEETRREFDGAIAPTLVNHFRADNDVQRNIYSYWALATGQGHAEYVGQGTSMRFHIDNPKHYEKYRRLQPMLLCMNDSEYATEGDRERARAFLAGLFPEGCELEKG